MGVHQIIVDWLKSKVGTYIGVQSFLRYENPQRAVLDFTDDNEIPNIRYVKAISGPSSRVNVPITTYGQVYASGITAYIPSYDLFIVRSSTDWEKWNGGETHYDPTTGDITVNVDAASDSYVLVVG